MDSLSRYLVPVHESLLVTDRGSMGSIVKYQIDKEEGKPNSIAIIGCPDLRGIKKRISSKYSDIQSIRKEFYKLSADIFSFDIYDLGDVISIDGDIEETRNNLKEVVKILVKNKILPIVLGGGMDLTYSIFQALSIFNRPLSYTFVDSRISVEDASMPLSEVNYLSKMVVDEGNHMLFNISTLGYQSYFVAPYKLQLFEELSFESYRLGEISGNLYESEPVFRYSDFISFNMDAMESLDSSAIVNPSPNGLNGREICALARYAGWSEKNKVFGVFNFISEKTPYYSMLVSQVIWYFIDGRVSKMKHSELEAKYVKYTVLHEDIKILFLKDERIDRWWLTLEQFHDNQEQMLIPCSLLDYQKSLKGDIPERYLKILTKFL